MPTRKPKATKDTSAAAGAAPPKPPAEADVVVVGAGLAGLTAATHLLRGGVEPLVVEARGRVGGRTLNEPLGDGAVVEHGGQWLAKGNERMGQLARTLGEGLFRTHTEGKGVVELGGALRYQRGTLPPLRPLALVDAGIGLFRLDRLVRSVPVNAPWRAPRAAELDQRTFGEWMRRTLRTKEARALLDLAVNSVWATDPDRVNLLQALFNIGSTGGFTDLMTTKLQDRVVGGAGRIAPALAAALGERVVLNCPVTGVTQQSGSVRVHTAGGTVRARRVVIAVPPQLAAEIEFAPRLPRERELALESLPMGRATKISVGYERPFWRLDGLSGQGLTTEGPVTATFDNSQPGNGGPGMLVAFVPGRRSTELAKLPEKERREAVLGTLTRLFGPEAAKPTTYHEKNWTEDPWTRGGFMAVPGPGVVCGPLRTLRDPIGAVHWAGSETVLKDYGGMEGAVASGERAAGEVLSALANADPEPAAREPQTAGEARR